MTTVSERTRSVIETGAFIARLSRDKSLPRDVREQARQLLRHYPTAEAIRLAGRCEAIRQDEISKLAGIPNKLHPALATWPLLDPFFCDFDSRDLTPPIDLPALNVFPTLQPIPRNQEETLAIGFQVLGQFASSGTGCLSIEYRCFVSAQAQVLARATMVLGSQARARIWFVSCIQRLDRRQPCTLMHNGHELALVMDVLTSLEHGVF